MNNTGCQNISDGNRYGKVTEEKYWFVSFRWRIIKEAIDEWEFCEEVEIGSFTDIVFRYNTHAYEDEERHIVFIREIIKEEHDELNGHIN